jgi:rod shape-determining protein MreD
MGRIIFWTSLTVLFFSLFEAAILSNLMFLSVVPDLVLLIVVYVSFMNSSIIGTTSGFISGLLLDFLSASPIGLNSFTKTVTGFIAGKFSGSFNQNKIFLPALMGFSATILKAILIWILSFFFGSNILIYRISGSVFWLEVLANTVCAPLIFALLGLFSSFFVEDSRLHE